MATDNNAAAAAVTGTAETTEKKKTTQELLNQRGTEMQAGITSAYSSNLDAQKNALLNAYNANTAAQTQQGQDVQKAYQTASQDVGVQNARNAANLNRFADVRGVNRQAGSQQALSLGNAAMRSTAAVDFAKQQALQENERQQQLMTTNYQNLVQAAIADNDYKKAAALLDDYKNQQKWQEEQAEILASYGNFDPYKTLYGDEAGTAMQKVWNAQNPDVAYRTGQIDAETYKNITGKYPEGYHKPLYFDTSWYTGYGGGGGNPKLIPINLSATIGAGKDYVTEAQNARSAAINAARGSNAARGGTTVNKAGLSGGKGKF